jgi:hypothetical protein
VLAGLGFHVFSLQSRVGGRNVASRRRGRSDQPLAAWRRHGNPARALLWTASAWSACGA